jgi:hypothetical protein
MAATINQDTVGDKRYYDAENARLFKENADLKKLVEQIPLIFEDIATLKAALEAAKGAKE